MAESLGKKALNGVAWNIVNKFGTQLLGILPSMILARLLGPSEYGLIAAAGIFSGIAYIISTGSFGSALIQKKDADHLDFCSVYYFNILMNVSVYLVFFFLAPLFADFLNEPLVSPIMRLSLLSLPFLAIGQVHSIILRKELNFKAPAVRNLIVQLISAIVAIILAFAGCSVWSIVVQGILQTLLGSMLNWKLCSWRPTFDFSMERLKSMFGFSFNIYFNNLLHYCFTRGYDTTIAKVYTAEDLSYYNRAFSTVNLFISTATGVIDSTVFPVFSKMQNDSNRLRYNLRRFILVENLLVTFMMFMAFALTEPIFRFLYSSKWDAVIPLFQILCVWGLFVPLKSLLENTLKAVGNSRVILVNAVINKVLIVLILAIGWSWGVKYIVAAQILTIAVEVFVFSFYVNRKIVYSFFDIMRDILPTLTQLGVLFGFVFLIDMMVNAIFSSIILSEFTLSLVRLILGGFCSVSLFIIINQFVRISAYTELFEFLFFHNPKIQKYKRLFLWK